jgi:hypothetical protein
MPDRVDEGIQFLKQIFLCSTRVKELQLQTKPVPFCEPQYGKWLSVYWVTLLTLDLLTELK